jgi:signal transduction histidine kinase
MNCEQHRQDKMRRRTDNLEDVDHRRDQILTTLAHELSSPLAAVAYSAELLRGRDITPEVRERAATIILEQTDFMRRLVEDISDLRGIRSGNLGFRKTLTDLADVARLAVGISRPLIERLGHALEIVTPQSPIRAQGDVARLIRVVSNLLINAARYTPKKGHIRLSIEQDDGAAVLRVKDNGIGIPKEMLTRVFDLFTRLESAKQKYAGGMGIGLALVRELVEAHGGRVEAFSEGEGRGSEFVVRLPLADDMRLSATDVAAVDQGRYRTPPEAELRAMPVS